MHERIPSRKGSFNGSLEKNIKLDRSISQRSSARMLPIDALSI